MKTFAIAPTVKKSLTVEFTKEMQAGQRSGNYALVTGSGLRLALLSCDVEAVRCYLLTEMGISARVSLDKEGILIAITDRHAVMAIFSAVKGSLQTLVAATADGRQAIKVFLPNLVRLH